ncbi:MAG: zinc ABC transporter substrate-binding protein [Acidobacteria bacterium]|nr:zinc ABC transporter substrate-binding protein [Acidobacteriota bacterium]
MTISRRFLLQTLGVALLLAPAGGGFAAPAPIRLVAALPNLGSIAAAIGGDRVDITTIAVGTQDAHFVDPKPSFMVKLRAADLILVNGLDLEIGWIPPLTQGARNPKILQGAPGFVDCSQGIQVLEVPTNLSRTEGDVHPYGNPHYLTDPLNAIVVAGTIAEALKKIDPSSSDYFEGRKRDFVKAIHEATFGKELVDLVGGAKLTREASAGTLDAFLDATSVGGSPLRSRLGGWLGRMQPARGKPVVSYHKDYTYFAARFGLDIVEYVEPKPGIQPSAKHLEELIARLKKGDIRAIVSRPYVEHRSTDYVAEQTGVKVLTLPIEVGGAPEAADYFKLFDHVTGQLASALSSAPPGAGH